MEEQIFFKLRFKDIIYNIKTEGTSYKDIIRAIEKKKINLNFYIINYISFNDGFQEVRQLTLDNLNDFIIQRSKIIEIELNRSDQIIREIYTTFYLKKINKNNVNTIVSQLKKNYIKERTERAFRLRDKLKVNISLLKLSEKSINQSTFLFAPSMKLSQLKLPSTLHISQIPISIAESTITTTTKENYKKCILCNCELTEVIYLCGICKKNFHCECFLCKKCKETKQHCHTEGFVEIKTPFDNFLKEEQDFYIKQSKTMVFKKKKETNFQGFENFKTNELNNNVIHFK